MAGDPLAARLAEIAVAPDADRHRFHAALAEAVPVGVRRHRDFG